MKRTNCVVLFYMVGGLCAICFLIPDQLKTFYPEEDLETAKVVLYMVINQLIMTLTGDNFIITIGKNVVKYNQNNLVHLVLGIMCLSIFLWMDVLSLIFRKKFKRDML